MSIAIQILGEPGTGKTFSGRNLDPTETYYVNCDKKSLPYKGWRKQYNEESKNYIKSSDPQMVQRVIRGISKSRPEIKQIIVDTVNSIMSDKEMNERKKKGYDKWMDLAGDIYDLYSLANSTELREDLVVVFIGHVESYQDNYTTRWRLKTNGAKLSKLNLEGKLTYTLYTQAEQADDGMKYYFLTQTDGYNTARSPYGLFDAKIDNDLAYVIDSIRKFENGDD